MKLIRYTLRLRTCYDFCILHNNGQLREMFQEFVSMEEVYVTG